MVGGRHLAMDTTKGARHVEVSATVDRIEGDSAVILLGGHEAAGAVAWPVAALPEGVSEGSALRIIIRTDDESTEAARTRVESLLKKLVARGS